jgi:hypothetical protein
MIQIKQAVSGLRFPPLQIRCFFPAAFGCAEDLPVEADAFEPVVKAKKIGETHAAVHFGGQAGNVTGYIAKMRLAGSQCGVRRRAPRTGERRACRVRFHAGEKPAPFVVTHADDMGSVVARV